MELLVVVAILLVLIGVATPLYMSYLEQSRLRIAKTDAVRLAGELKNFYVLNSQYPPAGTWDLVALEKNPPLDPWNNPYQWDLTEMPQADGSSLLVPVVWSGGPNGQYGPESALSSLTR
jgi:Tfp pilus assembly protein PilE